MDTTNLDNEDKKINDVYNQGHDILRIFDTLPDFMFTTSETKRDY